MSETSKFRIGYRVNLDSPSRHLIVESSTPFGALMDFVESFRAPIVDVWVETVDE